MKKIYLRGKFPLLYTATVRPARVEPPGMNFLMLDGRGAPNTAPECRLFLHVRVDKVRFMLVSRLPAMLAQCVLEPLA